MDSSARVNTPANDSGKADDDPSPKTNLGKLLSSYYDESNPNMPDSPVSMYAPEAERLPTDLGLDAILSKWRVVIQEETELKGEMKSLLYENCDKFFTCIHLISKLNSDIEVMQSKNLGEIATHIATLSMKHSKRDNDQKASVTDNDEAGFVRNVETSLLASFDASSLLHLTKCMQQTNACGDYFTTLRIYLKFKPLLTKFTSRFVVIKNLSIDAEALAKDAVHKIETTTFAVDPTALFWIGLFQPGRQEAVSIVVEALKALSVEPGNFLKLAQSAEEAVIREKLKAGVLGDTDWFVEVFLRSVFETSRFFGESNSFLLTALKQPLRVYALQQLRNAAISDAPTAESFARRIGHYLTFGQTHPEEEKRQFLADCAERWTTNCFNRAVSDFQVQDLITEFSNPGNLAVLLHSRATAAGNEARAFYSKLETSSVKNVVSEAKSFYFTALLGDCAACTERFGEEAFALQLLRVARLAETRGTIYRTFWALQESFATLPGAADLEDPEKSVKDMSEKLKSALTARYLRVAAGRVAGILAISSAQADKEVSEVLHNVLVDDVEVVKVSRKASADLTGDLLQAERMLARRVALTARPGEWRSFFLKLLLKDLTEQLRRSLKPTLSVDLEISIQKWLGPELSALPTLKAMIPDIAEALGV